jgi:hypothetical protein
MRWLKSRRHWTTHELTSIYRGLYSERGVGEAIGSVEASLDVVGLDVAIAAILRDWPNAVLRIDDFVLRKRHGMEEGIRRLIVQPAFLLWSTLPLLSLCI